MLSCCRIRLSRLQSVLTDSIAFLQPRYQTRPSSQQDVGRTRRTWPGRGRSRDGAACSHHPRAHMLHGVQRLILPARPCQMQFKDRYLFPLKNHLYDIVQVCSVSPSSVVFRVRLTGHFDKSFQGSRCLRGAESASNIVPSIGLSRGSQECGNQYS